MVCRSKILSNSITSYIKNKPWILYQIMSISSFQLNSQEKKLRRYIIDNQLLLRKRIKETGDYHDEQIWKSHISNKEYLKEYASNMHKLATCVWDRCSNMRLRITWTYDRMHHYFYCGGMYRHIKEEYRHLCYMSDKKRDSKEIKNEFIVGVPLKVLDVGSCYNPFGIYKNLEVTPIDICPAIPEVIECDFLHLKVRPKKTINEKEGEKNNEINSTAQLVGLHYESEVNGKDSRTFGCAIDSMVEESFDAVLFCQFISYIPSPRLRHLCCRKAYDLLKTNGLLMIITPTSSYSYINSHMADMWNVSLSLIGFQRVKYKKQKYFHAMVFRKGIFRHIWRLEGERILAELKEKQLSEENMVKMFSHFDYHSLFKKYFIHQDFIISKK